ncbi:hypothetical protein jhhlp_002182 [Lomentospora prolificans]|uniref:Uncharacterized protein n=1 Tax=Lomentospora prolificans TaxID=41688 RepID=A0A2N3NDC9_9PEZI|nr:hypothetical protein jhhlp_002182 [Lomentospora prolificans]
MSPQDTAPPPGVTDTPAPTDNTDPPPPAETTPNPPPPSNTPDPTPTTETSAPPPNSTPDDNEKTTSAPEPTETNKTDNPDRTSVVVTVITRPASGTVPGTTTTATSTGVAASDNAKGGTGGLDNKGKIAIAVVVPVVAVALFLVAAIWFWKRRKARKDAEEERRKEVEDYAYNPNADPTIPAVGLVGGAEGPYEMREDTTAGYRGWGSTATPGSTGPKAPTTLSGGYTGVAYSDATSPPHAHVSDTRSGEPLVDGSAARDGSYSPEGEILGAMGPSAAANRGDIRRGPSNASSSYSAGARSDGSAEGGMGGAYPNQYYDQYGGGNPYANEMYGGQRPVEAPAQPVIRDNPARRNTRIESPSHYPQQSAGISQNF